MNNEKNRHVIPGEVIVSGNYRSEQNTFMEGNKIISSVIGLSDIHDGSVRVIPLTGGYIPKSKNVIDQQVNFQAEIAKERSDLILFLVDGRSDLTSSDRILAEIIKKSNTYC